MEEGKKILQDFQRAIDERITDRVNEARDRMLEKTDSDILEGAKQIASSLGVTVGTVHNWIRKGIIQKFQPSGKHGKIYVKRSEIQRLIGL